MPSTGIYFLASSPHQPSWLPYISEVLHYRYKNLQTTGPWRLEHRLMRETCSLISSPLSAEELRTQSTTRYVQFLLLSHHPGRSYVAVSPDSSLYKPQSAPRKEPAVEPEPRAALRSSVASPAVSIVAVSAGPSSDQMHQFVTARMGPLWTHRNRSQVLNGISYSVGDYVVRVGDLRHGQNTQFRGCIVEIEWTGGTDADTVPVEGDDGESADEVGDAAVRAFWEALDIPGAREVLNVPGRSRDGFGVVRQYVELLRLR